MGFVFPGRIVGAATGSSALLSSNGSIRYASALNGTIFAAHLYVPSGGASTYLVDRVFQEAQAMGITHLHLWQYNFDERKITITQSQLVDAVHRMKNYGLSPIIDLGYDVNNDVALVTELGTDCMIYEVGKEPHISGTGGYATVDQYVAYFNQIVSACREVNPDAMYGGPTVGSPTTSPESRSGVYVNAYLQQCDGDFLSVHSYPGGSTQAEAITRARSYTIQDIQSLKQKLVQYGKPDMPIAFTEMQWTAGVTTNGWDYDQNFNDQWTTAVMSTMEEYGSYIMVFWCLIGYDNNFAILRPPSYDYERKPQFYSIQSYLTP